MDKNDFLYTFFILFFFERFRNMIESTVIPKKRARNDMGTMGGTDDSTKHRMIQAQQLTSPESGKIKDHSLYHDLPPIGGSAGSLFASSLSSKLGISLPNPAPDIDFAVPAALPPSGPGASAYAQALEAQFEDPDEPKRKKYAKEAWPGRKPNEKLLV